MGSKARLAGEKELNGMCKKTKTSARFSKTMLWPILDSFLIISKIARHCNGRQRLCSETKRDLLKKKKKCNSLPWPFLAGTLLFASICRKNIDTQVLNYSFFGSDGGEHPLSTCWEARHTGAKAGGMRGPLLLAPRPDAALILQTLSGSGHPGLLLIRLCEVPALGRVNTDLTMSMMELLTPDRKIKVNL